MLKRKNRGNLFMVLVPFAMLFAGMEAMAALNPPVPPPNPPPTSCTFVDAKGSPTLFTVTAAPGNPYAGIDPDTQKPAYAWAYTVTGVSPQALNILVPVCPASVGELGYKGLGGSQVQVRGTGDPTTGFGLFDFQDQVVSMKASGGSGAYLNLPPGYAFTTARPGDITNASMAIKVSNSTYYCYDIAGPSCIQSQVVAVETAVHKTICVNQKKHPGVCWDITLGPGGDLISVKDGATDLTIYDLASQTVITGGPEGKPLRYMKEGLAEWGDDSCYTYVSAGRLVSKCY